MMRSIDGIGSGDFLLLGGIGSSITLCLFVFNKNADKELPLGFGLGLAGIFYCLIFISI